MNPRRGLRVITLLAFAAAHHAASAETLEEAWVAALASDGRLAAATSRTAASEAALAAARAERQPTVTAMASTSRWRDTPAFDFGAAGLPGVLPLFAGQSMNLAATQVEVPLYTGGALKANVAAAAAALDGQGRSTDALRQDLKLGVAEAYVGVLRATSALSVARSTRASLAAHARDVEDMRRTGQVPTNDYLAAAVALADAEQRELTAQSALDVADALYNRRLGRPLDAPVSLTPLDEPLIDDFVSVPLAARVEAARAHRPELAELDAATAASAARANAARAAHKPKLAVSGGYAYLENAFLNRQDFWFLSLGVRINLFDGGRARQATAALERQSAALADDRRDRAAEVEFEVYRASADVTTARARVDVAASAVTQAEENLRVVRDRYRNGEGTNTEVLDAETLRAMSATNLDTARYDARLAELRLERAVGAL